MPAQTIDPDTFRAALNNLIKRIRKCTTKTISLKEIRLLAKAVAKLWFHDVAPFAALGSDNHAALQLIDHSMRQLLAHTLGPTKKETYLETSKEALQAYDKGVYIDLLKFHGAVLSGASSTGLGNDDVADGLSKISDSLSEGYEQVRKDLCDDLRLSWRGTANEIREVLRELLEILAPDSEVTKAPWYKQDPHTKRPTQAQKARYALEQRAAQKPRVSAAQETIKLVEASIEKLVRRTYQRASNAAHTQQDRDEAKRILGYFDLLAKDLLGLS